MKSLLAFILSFLIVSSAQASFIDSNGSVVRQWHSYDQEKLSNEIAPLKAKFTKAYFDKWLSDSIEKKHVEKLFMARFFSVFKNKKMIDVKADALLGDADRKKDEIYCYRFNGACNLFKEVGYERGIMMIYIYDQYGVNTTHHVTEVHESVKRYNGHHTYFSKEELLSIIIGLELYGDNIKYHTEDDLTMTYVDINENADANEEIYYFRGWRGQDFTAKVATVLHEMYHRLAGAYKVNSGKGLMLDTSLEWVKLHQVSRKISNEDGLNCFVSEYATSNFHEDAAETLVAYFHNREILERLCPQKIAIIEEAFRVENAARGLKRSKLVKDFGKNLDYLFESLDHLITN